MKNLLLFISLLLISHLSFAQYMQQGSDVEGENEADLSGWSASINDNGSIVAIGAPDNDGNGFDSGHVRMYEFIDGNWIQRGEDINGEAPGDNFGYSVSLSADGNVVAVGAPYNNGGGNNSGHVCVYAFQDGNWVQLGEDIDGEASGDWLGWNVSLSRDGNRVAVGAPLNSGNGTNSGRVKIYELQGDSWEQLGLDIDGPAPGNRYGTTTSLGDNGNRIAIGAPTNGDNGLQAGHVRIYEYDEDNFEWVSLGSTIRGKGVESYLGKSVSFSRNGRRLAIGGGPDFIGDGAGGTGYVEMYDFNGEDWEQVGNGITGLTGERMAYSISLSGDGNTLAIGAPGNTNANGLGAGRMQIYRYNGNNWIQQGEDILGEAGFDQSGSAVQLSSSGSTVVTSAPYNNGVSGPDSGHVRVFSNNIALSVDDQFAAELRLFPNPNVNRANITFPNTQNSIKLRLHDIQGRLVYQEQYQSTDRITLDTASLTKGVYLVSLVTGEGKKATLKMVVN